MWYKTLADQYLKQAHELKKHIKYLKAESESLKNFEYEQIHYRIIILYGMYLDLMHMGKYLNRKHEVIEIGK